MNKEKEIKEFADEIRRTRESYFGQADYLFAKKLFEDGYRKQEWISVDERLPDKELTEFRNGNKNVLYPCLAFVKHSFLNKGYINKVWYTGSQFVEQNTDDVSEAVTHWMPLPEAPKMKGGAE